MIMFLLIVAYVAFFIWIVRNILSLTYLWQLKEYRFDRLFIHLKETKQGRDLIFCRMMLFKLTLLLAYPLFGSSFEGLATAYPILVASVFLVDGFKTIRELKDKTLRIPVRTLKSTFMIGACLILVLVFMFLPLTDDFFWLLVIDRLTPFVLGYLVFFLSVPTEFYRDRQIAQAMEKLSKHKKLLVIAVTGSYGKSSTKEFVAAILGRKFQVLKTAGTNNTPIGIAMTILNLMTRRHQIFVVEMGAYKRGEIRQLCSIVRPRIGILTGINDQHLSLFGSLENTMAAKYELIESLPKNGLALFNGENDYARTLYGKTKHNRYLYVASSQTVSPSDIRATDIVVRRDGIEFDVMTGKTKFHVASSLLGKHNVENLLPAIFLAKRLGMSKQQIKEAVSTISPLPMTLKPIKSKSGALFIDDTFNANPKALQAALEYLKVFRGKRVLVLQPMIELGKEAGKEHYIAGKVSSRICDHIFLTNNNFTQDFRNGAREENKDMIVSVFSPVEIADELSDMAGSGTTILFEGKEAGVVLKRINEGDRV